VAEAKARVISFYLPQFHSTPYNDEWWGKGFTEWTNVVKAVPHFPGHYQPHIPTDLGYYDLRSPEVRELQAALARAYGIYGFCYYHYWFSGRQLLDEPLNGVLASGKPDFPFCICWANENWTRAWDGLSRKILMEQRYSAEDDLAHIRQLIPMLRDSRYIRIEGKPLVLIYRVELLPDCRRTAEIWRDEAKRAGLLGLFLVNVQGPHVRLGTSPQNIGFDAAIRFQPNIRELSPPNKIVGLLCVLKWMVANGWRPGARGLSGNVWKRARMENRFVSHERVYKHWKASQEKAYRHFHCVTPMWDNTARRGETAWIIRDSSPEIYEAWLREAIEQTAPDCEGFKWVFVNAWNEWGEGCHLEPCQKWGKAYLEATSRAIELPTSPDG